MCGDWTTSWVVPKESLSGKKERDLETLLDGVKEVGTSGDERFGWEGGKSSTVREGASQQGLRGNPRPQK